MASSENEQVREIFLAAYELPPDQRAQFLDSACKDDAALRREIESLLASDATDTSRPPTEMRGPNPNNILEETDLTSIGPYRLIEIIGSGGMGVVYKAEQRSPIRRTVAVKLIKLGYDSHEVIARFESERQALARMDHPNIARVLDAGTDERGRPYFVMEYVPGQTITKYADENRLSIQQRLEVMLQVCDAIGHAHAKGIIHRDIKAGNVLAYTTPDGPRVKVIDFGIAKALTSDRLTDMTLNTVSGQAIGTYESMSPEQAEGSPDIDTRTDVYSLGVLLYELLSGSKPFDKSNLAKAAHAEVRRIIREDEPPRPSTQLSSLGESATKIANARQLEVEALTRQLKAELDWIPLMALRKERERRYATPQQMREDIQNYLEGRPLFAAPDSAAYRLRKFTRRNRGPIIAAVGLVGMLLLGIAGTTLGLVRESHAKAEAVRQTGIARHATAQVAAALADAQDQRAAAEKQRVIAEEQRSKAEARFGDVRQLANDFMFKFDGALMNVSGATSARKMLADTASQYLDRLSRDASGDKSLSRELAVSYGKVGDILGFPDKPNLGEPDLALASYHKSLAIFEKLALDAPKDLRVQGDVAVNCERLGAVQMSLRKLDDALSSFQKALETFQKMDRISPNNPRIARAISVEYVRLGDIDQANKQNDAALGNFSKALEVHERLLRLEPDNPIALRDLSVSSIKVGDIQIEKGDLDSALKNYRKALEISCKRFEAAPEDSLAERDFAASKDRVASLLVTRGQNEDALKLYLESLEIRQKLDKEDSANTRAHQDLAKNYSDIGDVQEKRNDLPAALANYTAGEKIDQQLAGDLAGNVSVQRDLAGAHGKVAEIYALLGDQPQALMADRIRELHVALDELKIAQDLFNAIQSKGQMEPGDRDMPSELHKALQKARDQLAILETPAATQPAGH